MDHILDRSRKKDNITLNRETDDKQDRVIALGKSDQLNYNKKGELTNKTHMVDKGILSQKNHYESKNDPDAMTNSENVSRDHYEIKGKSVDKSVGLFKFLSKNTNVEWQLTKGIDAAGNKLGVLATSHQEGRISGGSNLVHWYIDNKAFIPYANYHNHPNGAAYPSGEAGDRGSASEVRSKIPFPITKFYVFTSTPKDGDRMTEY